MDNSELISPAFEVTSFSRIEEWHGNSRSDERKQQ